MTPNVAVRSGSRAAQKLIRHGYVPQAEIDGSLYFSVPDRALLDRLPRDHSWRDLLAGRWGRTTPRVDGAPRPINDEPAPPFVLMRHRERRTHRIGAYALAAALPFVIAAVIVIPRRPDYNCRIGQPCPPEPVDLGSYLTMGMAACVVAALLVWGYGYRLHLRAGQLEAQESRRQNVADVNRVPGWNPPT